MTNKSPRYSDTPQASYTYDEFGSPKTSAGTLYNPLRYCGASNAYYDEETDLYKIGARYYRASIGRWITRDPFPGVEQAPESQHKYAYAENDPVNNVDSNGCWIASRHQVWSKAACLDSHTSQKFAKWVGYGSYITDSPPYQGDAKKYKGKYYLKWPVKYHFDYSKASGKKGDSRWLLYQQRFKEGVRAYKKKKWGQAGKLLGIALHAFPQDYYAHGYIRFREHRYPVLGMKVQIPECIVGYVWAWGVRFPIWGPPVWAPDSTLWAGDADYVPKPEPGAGWAHGIAGTSTGWPGYGRRASATQSDTGWCVRNFLKKIRK